MRNSPGGEVHVTIREHCEVVALKYLIQLFQAQGYSINWRIVKASVNTDFDFLSLDTSFSAFTNVTILEDSKGLEALPVMGFLTDMRHDTDRLVKLLVPVYKVLCCCNEERQHPPQFDVVIGNIKIKAPMEEFQVELFDRLASLRYRVLVVPRHPINSELVSQIRLPESLQLINSMGNLARVYASARLTVMGRVFSENGTRPDDDHNPLEATTSSHTICGINNSIPNEYKWLYERSGLVHQCESVDDVFCSIDKYFNDESVPHLLRRRERWIQMNRYSLRSTINQILTIAQLWNSRS